MNDIKGELPKINGDILEILNPKELPLFNGDINDLQDYIYLNKNERRCLYTDDIRQLLSNEMDLNQDILKDKDIHELHYVHRSGESFSSLWLDFLKIGFFSAKDEEFINYQVGDTKFKYYNVGGYKSGLDLLLICIDDYDLKKQLPFLIHEVGRYLSLYGVCDVISEACGLRYERKWYIKNNNLDIFNKKYPEMSFNRTSLSLLDMIKKSVFYDIDDVLDDYIELGSEQMFFDKINKYLQSKEIIYNAYDLFELCDLMYYYQMNSTSFDNKEGFYSNLYNNLHQYILPTIFNDNVSKNNIMEVNTLLDKYMYVIKVSNRLLEYFKTNYCEYDYLAIKRMFKQFLAEELRYLNNDWSIQDILNRSIGNEIVIERCIKVYYAIYKILYDFYLDESKIKKLGGTNN